MTTGARQMAESDPPIAATSFAGFLASVAAPPKPAASGWDVELADDMATISYEPALRMRARYIEEDSGAKQTSGTGVPGVATVHIPATAAPIPAGPSAPPEKDLKRASITIRLSAAECAQVRERAAEAGLTVSAYLRSCALEVESLRGQVKETLARLRSRASGPTESTSAASAAAAESSRPSALSNLRRFWGFAARHEASVSVTRR